MSTEKHCENKETDLTKRNKIQNKFLNKFYVNLFVEAVFDEIGFDDELNKIYAFPNYSKYFGNQKFIDTDTTLIDYLKINVEFKTFNKWDLGIHTEKNNTNFFINKTYVSDEFNNKTVFKELDDYFDKNSIKNFFSLSDIYEDNVYIEFKDRVFDSNIFCDIKTQIGDDYYKVLEQLKKKLYKTYTLYESRPKTFYVVLVEKFFSKTLIKRQLVELFRNEGIYVMFLDEAFELEDKTEHIETQSVE